MAKVKTVRLVGRESHGSRNRKAGKGLDPSADFDTPMQISAEELQANNPTAEMPTIIRGGRMSVNYVKPHFDVDQGNRSVGLELSLELTEDHATLLPRKVSDALTIMKSGDYKRLDILGIAAQHFELCLTATDERPDLEGDAMIEKVSLAMIGDKGAGTAKDVIRLSFRILCELDKDVQHFACNNFGETVWLKMQAVQGELL